MKFVNQIWGDLKAQPVIGVVSIVGTTLSIFLIMIVVMMQDIKVAPFAPESNRERLLYGCGVHTQSIDIEDESNNDGNSSYMSLKYARMAYDGLPHIEEVSYCIGDGAEASDLSRRGTRAIRADKRIVDDAYFNIFDYTFIEGKPIDKASSDAGLKEAVIAESMARELFNGEPAVGKEVLVGQRPYTVCGVIEDVSELANKAYGQVFVTYNSEGRANERWGRPESGPFVAYMLIDDMKNAPEVRDAMQKRLWEYDTQLKSEGLKTKYHQAPYDQETSMVVVGTNQTPDVSSERKTRYAIYAIMLLVPAINLSSMTQSRLRRRVAEMGVRRAFGCTRMRLIRDIIAENFLLTLAGGVLGFVLSCVFALLFSSIFIQNMSLSFTSPKLDISMLIHMSTFVFALLFCFLLNLLSSGVPAWRASRLNPVDALGGGMRK